MFRKQSWYVCLILVIALTRPPHASPARLRRRRVPPRRPWPSPFNRSPTARSRAADARAPRRRRRPRCRRNLLPSLTDDRTGAGDAECGRQSAPSPTRAASAAPVSSPVPGARAKVEVQPVPQGPTLLRAGITLRKVIGVGEGDVKLARNPADGELYYLHPANGLFRVQLGPTAATIKGRQQAGHRARRQPVGHDVRTGRQGVCRRQPQG